MSFSVIAGSSGRAKVTLTPLRGPSGPGEITRVTTSPESTSSTASRGTPSPTTIWERSVTSPAKPSRSTRSRPASRGALAAAEDHRVVDLEHALLRLRRQPQLRALQVEQQPERATGPVSRRPHRRGAAPQVVVRAV